MKTTLVKIFNCEINHKCEQFSESALKSIVEEFCNRKGDSITIDHENNVIKVVDRAKSGSEDFTTKITMVPRGNIKSKDGNVITEFEIISVDIIK